MNWEWVVSLSRSFSLSQFSARLGLVAAALCLSLASGLAQAEEFTNFNSMAFVDVPAGNFKMGSCKGALPGEPLPPNGCAGGELDVPFNEVPQHQVTVQGFQIGKTEVTLAQFKRYIIATDRNELVTDEFMDANARGDDTPVVQVSWNDAKAFIEWLNKNKPATDHGIYRLPVEAEWEHACRAGGSNLYCGSRSPSAGAWHAGNSGSHQQAVGRKDANAFGLYDMSGNAWEWVEDCYHDSYHSAPVDGTAWTKGGCTNAERVLRGGSWKDETLKMRSGTRQPATAVSRSSTIGLRLVRKAP